jgi:serine/threonine-protein kinase
MGVLVTASILALVAGAINWVVMPLLTRHQRETIVPTITGLTQSEAQQALRGTGLVLGEVRTVPSANVQAGKIVAQYPRPGRSVKRGRAVDVDVSSGVALLRVPAVEGLPVSNAIFMLQQSGLVISRIESLRTPRIPPDQVLAVRPAVGTEVTPGTEVILSVSTRLGMFRMPNLIGMNTETACGILASHGLVLAETRTALSSEPVGRVIFQYPEEGMLVGEGDSVTLIVSASNSKSNPPPSGSQR